MDNPIGLFDSGFGGLTVLSQLARLLPQENLIYLGDTVNLPYGNKPAEKIIQYARQNADFLLGLRIKLLVIPCHTACCYALKILQDELSIPVIGVTESGLELIQSFRRVAILGTVSTIESGFYQDHILRQNPGVRLFARSCPLFVPLIEEGYHEHEIASLITKKELQGLHGNIDAALLACTHYPFMGKVLQQELGDLVSLLDPAEDCVKRIFHILKEQNALRMSLQEPIHQFYVTGNLEKFLKIGKIFWPRFLQVKKVEINQKIYDV